MTFATFGSMVRKFLTAFDGPVGDPADGSMTVYHPMGAIRVPTPAHWTREGGGHRPRQPGATRQAGAP